MAPCLQTSAEHRQGRFGHGKAGLDVKRENAIVFMFDVNKLADAMKTALGPTVYKAPAALADRHRRRHHRGAGA